MDPTATEQELLDVFSAILDRPVDPGLTRLAEPKWDSLKHMELVFAVEEKFGVRFSEEEIAGLDSLARFSEHLKRRHEA